MQRITMNWRTATRRVAVRMLAVLMGVMVAPLIAQAQVCNADPVIAGTNFSNAAWTKSGWGDVEPSFVLLFADTGSASLSQSLNGVSPGAKVTFTWSYTNGNGGNNGIPATVQLLYGGTVFWSGGTSIAGLVNSPASSAQNGATCVSGCGALGAGTNRTVEIRLPSTIPTNGKLEFAAQTTGSGPLGTDDPFIRTPVSIANTGICLVKTSLGGVGKFDFTTTGVDTTMGGGGTAATITTTAVNTPLFYDASSTRTGNQPLLVNSPGATANVTIVETPAAGFSLESVACPGLTPVLTGNSLNIASVPQDTVATCTFTNRTPIINFSKALNSNRFAAGDNFTVAIRTGGASGPVVSSTTNATTAGSGATVTAGSGTTGDFFASAGTAFTLTEAAASGANLANYDARLTCTDSAGVTPVENLPTDEVFVAAAGRTITPLTGANLRCVVTNTQKPSISLRKILGGSGRIAASDQFTLSASGNGAPAAINSTGAGTAITSSAYTFKGSAGSAYVLNEAMAPGSSSALSAYRQTLACTNSGPTDVTGQTTLPMTLTLAAGDNISCTITNTPKSTTISLQKALGGIGRLSASDQFALSATGTGAPAAVSTTGATTVVTSPAYTFVAAPGSAYVLNEAMAAGSTSTLLQYKQSVTCTNAGGTTDVSALASLPINVTPAVGDAITCVITNTPAMLAVTGRVFLDNGIGGGTANDGILNGGEGPLSGVAVRLTNCAATVLSSALTDATGGYSLSVPAGTAAGFTMCVEETNPGTRLSTGASVGNVALPSGSAIAAAGGSYTYTRNATPDRIAFNWNSTGHNNLNFGDVDNSSFANDGAKTGLPGSTVIYPHTFTAGTAGQVRFSVASEVATPAIGGWTTKVFADLGCTGTLQVGAAQLYPPSAAATPVAFMGKVCVIVQTFIPSTAPLGASNKARVQADFSYSNVNPSLSGSFVLDDITTVSSVALELKKEVRNVTQGADFGVNNQAKSGETLEYRITYANNGEAPIRSMTVNDTTPSYTTFVSATVGSTPGTLSGCTKNTPPNPVPAAPVECSIVQPMGGTGVVDWKFTGFVAPGGTGSVLFQVKVN